MDGLTRIIPSLGTVKRIVEGVSKILVLLLESVYVQIEGEWRV
mgnify:CR=1 FL=1